MGNSNEPVDNAAEKNSIRSDDWSAYDAAADEYDRLGQAYDALMSDFDSTPKWRIFKRQVLWSESGRLLHNDLRRGLVAMQMEFAKAFGWGQP